MTYRLYPDADRARHQLDRHVHYAPAPIVRPETALLMENLMRAARQLAVPAMENARAMLRSLQTPAAANTPTPSDPGSGS